MSIILDYFTGILNAIKGVQKSEDKENATLVALATKVDQNTQGLSSLRESVQSHQTAVSNAFNELIGEYRSITGLLDQILAAFTPGPAVKGTFTISDPVTGEILFEGDSPMTVIQNRHTRRHIKLVVQDADENVTSLDQQDTPTTVESANLAVTIENVSITDAAIEFDTVTGKVAGIGPITITGDANRKTGETTPLALTLDINVPAGDAVTGNFQVGEEVPE